MSLKRERERERASIRPLSNGNNIVPSVIIAVVAVSIEVATIFNMRFSRRDLRKI
jgi:hypothetical protein